MISDPRARRQRATIATIVVAAHLLMAWVWLLLAQSSSRRDSAAEFVPIFARIIDTPEPPPLGTPAPVKVTLLPVTQPKPPTPELQPIEVETLDSIAPGPDPAPSASLVTRPGPANGGARGYPGSMGDKDLKVVRRVAPVYPREAAQRGDTGLVQMRARVDPRGRVTEVQLVRSSGFNPLDSAAMRAVSKWRFEPQLEKGRSVDAWTLVNVRMSTYQQSYCRIRDEPADGAAGEDVHDASAAATPGNEASMQRLINDLATGALQSPASLQAQLREWGPVKSIHYTIDTGYQGWVTRSILPTYQGSHAGNTVQVRWDAYEVRHQQTTTRWIVATDSAGEIWCAHFGQAGARP